MPWRRELQLVVFDFDGTLVDTAPVICGAFAYAVEATAAQRPARAFRPMLGQPLSRVHGALRAELPEFDLPLAEFIARYRFEHDRRADDEYRLFDGAAELLSAIRDASPSNRLAIASTKPTRILEHHCGRLAIAEHLHHIQGTDGFPHKPDPTILHRVHDRLPTVPQQTLFVGDSTMDMLAGTAAAVHCLGVSHGAHTAAELTDAGAREVFDNLVALQDFLFDVAHDPARGR